MRKQIAPKAKAFLKRVRGNIFEFADEMNFRPTHLQRAFMQDFQDTMDVLANKVEALLWYAQELDHKGEKDRAEEIRSDAAKRVREVKRRFAIRSGQGCGKGACTTILCLWFLLKWKGAKVVVTAPTARQISSVWIAEMGNRLMKGHKFIKGLFEVQTKQVGAMGSRPQEWGVLSFAASKAENAQGWHADFQLIMVDEASGVEAEILETIYGTNSGAINLTLLCGNPNSRTCGFYDAFRADNEHLWKTYHWSCEMLKDSIWFSTKKNEDIAAEFGIDSDVYRVRVQGEWPIADPGAILTEEEVLACMNEENMLACAQMSDVKRIAMDFARQGGDENAVFRRRGNAVAEWTTKRYVEPEWSISQGMMMQETAGWTVDECEFVCDASGIGQGIMWTISGSHRQLIEYHNGGKAIRGDMYADKITEGWFTLRRLVRERRIYIPYDKLLLQQLTTRNYGIKNVGGKALVAVEKKEDYKTRTKLPSPDRADALVMLFDDARASVKVAV